MVGLTVNEDWLIAVNLERVTKAMRRDCPGKAGKAPKTTDDRKEITEINAGINASVPRSQKNIHAFS